METQSCLNAVDSGYSHEGFGGLRYFRGFRDCDIPGMNRQPDWEKIHTGQDVSVVQNDGREYVPNEKIREIQEEWEESGLSMREVARKTECCYEAVRPVLKRSVSDQKRTRPGNYAFQALCKFFRVNPDTRGAA